MELGNQKSGKPVEKKWKEILAISKRFRVGTWNPKRNQSHPRKSQPLQNPRCPCLSGLKLKVASDCVAQGHRQQSRLNWEEHRL
jgi:hypothetical protein